MSYKIGMMTPEGIQTLEYFDSYSDAELKIDEYWELYPNAWIEILNEATDPV